MSCLHDHVLFCLKSLPQSHMVHIMAVLHKSMAVVMVTHTCHNQLFTGLGFQSAHHPFLWCVTPEVPSCLLWLDVFSPVKLSASNVAGLCSHSSWGVLSSVRLISTVDVTRLMQGKAILDFEFLSGRAEHSGSSFCRWRFLPVAVLFFFKIHC